MTRTVRISLKSLVWLVALVPLAGIVARAASGTLGADPAPAIASTTGLTALWMLVATLAITPARRLVPALNGLIHFRRLLGLFAFFYATLHMLTYVGLFSGFDLSTMLDDLTRRRFVIAGATAWLLLVPLALTSTQAAIRKLGGRNWKLLHKLTYAVALIALAHYWWKVKPGVLSPIPATLVIALLLVARLVTNRWKPGKA